MFTAFLLAFLFGQQATSSPATAVKPNTPFVIAWDEPASDTPPSYRWWCDSQIVKNFAVTDLTVAPQANADGSTTISATVPGLAPGAHTCTVSAFTAAFPADAQSAALSVPSGSPANTPKNLRIIQVTVIVGGGGQ